jgi:hypothetical protein
MLVCPCAMVKDHSWKGWMPEELCNRGLTKLPLALPIVPEHFGGRPKVHPYTTQTISSILLTVVYCTANVKFSNSNYSKKKKKLHG